MGWAEGVICRNTFSTPQVIFVTVFCILSRFSIFFLQNVDCGAILLWYVSHHVQITTIPFFRQPQVLLTLFVAKFHWQFVSNHLHAVYVLFLWFNLNSANYEICSSLYKFLFSKAKFILFDSVWPRSLFSATSAAFSLLDFMT